MNLRRELRGLAGLGNVVLPLQLGPAACATADSRWTADGFDCSTLAVAKGGAATQAQQEVNLLDAMRAQARDAAKQQARAEPAVARHGEDQPAADSTGLLVAGGLGLALLVGLGLKYSGRL